jgi:hypothetical protein
MYQNTPFQGLQKYRYQNWNFWFENIYHLAALYPTYVAMHSATILGVLRFFSEIKVAELQITDRHFTENGQISKL